MNSRLRWRSLTKAWTLPVTRSIPASKLAVPWRLYSNSRVKVGCTPGSGGKSGGVVSNRLNAGLLVIGDARPRLARLLVFLRRRGRRLLQHVHLAVDTQHLRHLGFELRVPAFEVVAHLVRLHLLCVEDLADGALGQPAQARMPLSRSMLAGMAGQKPRRPHLMRIAQLLRLPAGQRHHPRLGLDGDRPLPARAGTLVQRRQRTLGPGSLNAPVDSLSMQSHGLANRIERRA